MKTKDRAKKFFRDLCILALGVWLLAHSLRLGDWELAGVHARMTQLAAKWFVSKILPVSLMRSRF